MPTSTKFIPITASLVYPNSTDAIQPNVIPTQASLENAIQTYAKKVEIVLARIGMTYVGVKLRWHKVGLV